MGCGSPLFFLFDFKIPKYAYSSLNAHKLQQKLKQQSWTLGHVDIAQMPLVHGRGSTLITSLLGPFRGIHKLECMKTCLFYINRHIQTLFFL